jgi:hypothetical protein
VVWRGKYLERRSSREALARPIKAQTGDFRIRLQAVPKTVGAGSAATRQTHGLRRWVMRLVGDCKTQAAKPASAR